MRLYRLFGLHCFQLWRVQQPVVCGVLQLFVHGLHAMYGWLHGVHSLHLFEVHRRLHGLFGVLLHKVHRAHVHVPYLVHGMQRGEY